MFEAVTKVATRLQWFEPQQGKKVDNTDEKHTMVEQTLQGGCMGTNVARWVHGNKRCHTHYTTNVAGSVAQHKICRLAQYNQQNYK